MELGLAVQGNLQSFIDGEIYAIERGAMDAAYRMEARGKSALRKDVLRGGLGPKVAKTWQSTVYPQRTLSMNPTVRFKSKAAVLVRAFEEGVTIRSKDGFFLTIPTDEFLSSITKRERQKHRKNLLRLAEQKFGRLRFVFLRGKTISFLVADGLQKSKGKRGGFRVASDLAKRKGRIQDVVLFILVPQTKLRKRLNYRAIERDLIADWQEFLAKGIAQSLDRDRVREAA